ncbi:hypothetical protein HYALB_00010614 [Hymenoscyphus albidus]|uniref:DNA endonuclease activator Ctp1 C-terminal domain-containing protein n=1 Tax=Hymenoscyphus albidus TaxID=595503 RepID=A0A9N9LLQ3_9HELO|nr:hypothetical protein HYALB_00010614 [Hymenoscyphus albidus]
MESWERGREALFTELTRICNRIGSDVAAEIDEENVTRISKEELQSLQDRSVKVDELTRENGRLLEELKKPHATTLQLEELEKENKRLSELLEESRKKENTVTTNPSGHTRNVPNPIPISNEAPTEKKEGMGDRVSKYNQLVEKFNRVYESKKNAMEALEELKEKQRQKAQKYSARHEEFSQAILRKDAKIKKQKDVIIDYRKRLGLPDLQKTTKRAASEVSTTSFVEVDGLTEKDDASDQNAIRQKQNPTTESSSSAQALLGLLARPKEKPVIEGSSKSPNRHDVDQDEFPVVFEPPDPTYYPSPTGVPSSPAKSPQLPPNLLHEGRFHVEDTQFEPTEPFGSTQDDPLQNSSPHGSALSDRLNDGSRVESSESPDSPVFISSRSVKRRKRQNDDADQNTSKAIKVEIITSSPILAANVQELAHTESFDLDDIGERVDTPKKRRMLELSRKASRLSSGSQRNASFVDSPLSQLVAVVDQGEEVENESPLQPLNPNRLILPRTSNLDPKSPRRRRIASDTAVAALGEDESISDESGKGTRKSPHNDRRLDDLLTKTSPPKRKLRADNLIDPTTPDQQRPPRMSHINLPSELARNPALNLGSIRDDQIDGLRRSLEPAGRSSRDVSPLLADRPTSAVVMRKKSARPSKDVTPVSRPTKRVPNSEAPVTRTSSVGMAERLVESAPRPRLRRTDNLTPQSRQSRVGHKNGGEVLADYSSTPLRSLPLDELNITDFKINPNANQGLDYAFKDVVRGRDQRRCLQGCTKPECCGDKFRALAQITNDNRGSPTLSQEDADNLLLEEFLGDNAHKLQNMSKDERDEVLLQAKTRKLSNDIGRHRNAHERRNTPPGFWETDFPSTQEQNATCAASREFERANVANRYAQAMRPGGIWKFRDE